MQLHCSGTAIIATHLYSNYVLCCINSRYGVRLQGCTICDLCDALLVKRGTVLQKSQFWTTVTFSCYLRFRQYTCSKTAYCTAWIAALEGGYTVLRSASYAVYMQLRYGLNGDFCRTFVVNPCSVLRFMQYGHDINTNILCAMNHDRKLIAHVLQDSQCTCLLCLDVCIRIHMSLTVFTLQCCVYGTS